LRDKICQGLKLNTADIGIIGIWKVVTWFQGRGYIYNAFCTDSGLPEIQNKGTCRAVAEGSAFSASQYLDPIAEFFGIQENKTISGGGILVALLFIGAWLLRGK